MLKQSLQQKLLQKLSPQQIQTIKLLEVPTYLLEQRIKQELEENPVLEEGKEEENDVESIVDTIEHDLHDDEAPVDEEKDVQQDLTSIKRDDEDSYDDELIPAYKLTTNNTSKDYKKEDIPFSVGSTFKESLETQVGLRYLNDKQQKLAYHIIGNIDDDGYLRRELDAIIDDIAFVHNIETTKQELEEVLHVIHDLDPAGVGARSLQECLLLQLKRKHQDHPQVLLAKKILEQCFDEFTKKHYTKISLKLDVSDEQLKEAINEILKLSPKPGNAYSDSNNKDFQHVIPDFVLDNIDGKLILSLNSRNIPDIRLNKEYTSMLHTSKAEKKSKTERETISFIKQKADSARWFIDAIKQRQNTLMVTMNTILEYQKAYFVEGDETKMRPMILKDIADVTGLDISTISRVANSKYIQTHFGIFPLKYFFSESIQNDAGEEVSTREIKKILQECIENEDKKEPLNDDKLVVILKEKGYNIARRTIAKYREQLDIPVARLRKEL